MLFALLIGISSLLIITSCEYEIIEPLKIVIPPGDSVSFSLKIIPIFTDKCVTCHGTGHFAVDLTEANAYTDLFAKNMIDTADAASSVLYVKLIEVGGTHEGRSTPSEQALILAWIEDGAKNN